jgi:metal-responsive CopG/Arc/MetJ family transcriptional regulator
MTRPILKTRRRPEPFQIVAAALSVPMFDQVDELAVLEGVSRSEIVRRALAEFTRKRARRLPQTQQQQGEHA